MKLKEFLDVFIDERLQLFKIHDELIGKQRAKDLYGAFKIVSAKISISIPNCVEVIIDEPTCDCYEVTKERHYLTEYEKGYYYGRMGNELTYIDKEVSRCLGTREKDECTCGGYKSQCNFYREKFMKELEDKEKSK